MEPCRLLIQPQPQVWWPIHCREEVKEHSVGSHEVWSFAHFCRPEAQSTDCVRGRKSYSRYQVLLMCFAEPLSFRRGIHAWGFRWPKAKGERGTHAVVGVANNEQVRLVLSKNWSSKRQALHCMGYRSLVGSGVHCWGWDLGRASAYHEWEGMQMHI